jgi:predicted ATPase
MQLIERATQRVNAPKLYVLTGGPGSGKTTLLTELAQRGFRCVPEVARLIIQEQMQTMGVAVPWLNRQRYTEIMLERSIAAFLERVQGAGITLVPGRGARRVCSPKPGLTS